MAKISFQDHETPKNSSKICALPSDMTPETILLNIIDKFNNSDFVVPDCQRKFI
jgi:hypothetical protein